MLTNDDTKEIIAVNLRALMAEQGHSINALAKLTGDSVTTIFNAYHGKKLISAGVLARISSVLGVDVGRLYYARGESEKIESPA